MHNEVIAQICLSICSLTAIALSFSSEYTVRRYSPIFGIAAQPFWLYSTYGKVWAIFGLSIIYTFVWCIGLYRYWFSSEARSSYKSRDLITNAIKVTE